MHLTYTSIILLLYNKKKNHIVGIHLINKHFFNVISYDWKLKKNCLKKIEKNRYNNTHIKKLTQEWKNVPNTILNVSFFHLYYLTIKLKWQI